MTSKSHVMRSISLNRGGETPAPILVTLKKVLARIPASALSLAKAVTGTSSASKIEHRREELRLAARALGYAGFPRAAAKRFAELQRLDAGV